MRRVSLDTPRITILYAFFHSSASHVQWRTGRDQQSRIFLEAGDRWRCRQSHYQVRHRHIRCVLQPSQTLPSNSRATVRSLSQQSAFSASVQGSPLALCRSLSRRSKRLSGHEVKSCDCSIDVSTGLPQELLLNCSVIILAASENASFVPFDRLQSNMHWSPRWTRWSQK